MNTLGSDKELSDLLDFSAMFAPPGSMVGKTAGTLADATLSGSLHSRTGTLDENSTWPSTVSGFDRSYHSENHGLYIEDDGEFLSRKNSSFSNYLSSNSLASLGKSKDPYTTTYSPGYRDPGLGTNQGSNEVSLSGNEWRSRKYKSSKSNGSMSSVYSPGGEDMMAHPDSVPQSHYSPKGGLYGDSYFIEHGSPDPWSHSGQLGTTSSAYSTSGGTYGTNYGITAREGMKNLHGVPVAALAKGPMHQPRGYHPISHSEMDRLAGLPPMSSFRQTATLHGQTSPYLHTVSPPLNGNDNMGHTTRAPTSGSQTGDTLGKALASIYSTDNGTTYSSNPSTPVGSPPPLASVSERPLSAGSGASGHSSGWGRTNQPTSPPYEGHLHPMREATRPSGTPMELQNMQYMPPKQSRIEERLDDAIHVLRNHAESNLQLYGAAGGQIISTTATSGAGYTTSVGGTMQSAVSHLDQLQTSSHGGMDDDPSMTSPSSMSNRTMSVSQMSPATSDISEVRYGSKGDKDGKSNNDSVKAEGLDKLDDLDKDKSLMDDLGDKGDDDDLLGNDRDRMVREQERRYANNARERMRVRDINEAFKELGRMCQLHLQSEKPQTKERQAVAKARQKDWSLNDASYGSNVPQTKLVILHQAVSVITSLESQVRERNLNPKAACLKRREEEKVEEESPEKRAVPGVDKPFDNSAVRGNNRAGRRGRRSSRGAEDQTPVVVCLVGPRRGTTAPGSHGDSSNDQSSRSAPNEAAMNG
ncbi:transcription factor 12 isoform X3 [Nematostella vectensis]|uniref:transcription factor 12 isoform X3 n=1 Tax=Nematostella vectensis TaxID=45351 RepID=UPI0013904573|nr:transcription factor 12 isoform X3 [Nematostella vectensis]